MIRCSSWLARGLVVAAGLLWFGLAGGCETAPGPTIPEATVTLHPNFGTYHRRIETASPEAQRWFDQGLQLLYGFNHDEAIRSFHEAAKLDPECLMAWWGVAYGHGLHINNPEMSEQQSREGWLAVEEARAMLLERAEVAEKAEEPLRIDPLERALLDAVALRCAWPAPADRTPLDRAYADAMGRLWQRYPDDPDVGALYAEALLNLQPWDLWTKNGAPKGRTEEILAVLETVLAMRPDHPGANHFYIHTVEGSPAPERGLAAAERLGTLVPGSGHLVHMPSHIYARLGDYARAADANERAIEADLRYFERAPAPVFYGLYIVHNYHFLAYAAMMEGRFEVAMNAARELTERIPPAFLEQYKELADGFMATPRHVKIRFGRWEQILHEMEPPPDHLVGVAFHHYARSIAYASLGRISNARTEQREFEEARARVTADWYVGVNPAPDVLRIASAMLAGELLFRQFQYDEAFVRLRAGVELEDALLYDEPPGWMQPVRHALGALLVARERYDEAIEVYRADLVRNPDNGWALLGLEQAYRRRGSSADRAEAARLAERRARIWTRSDVYPEASCYCQPPLDS